MREVLSIGASFYDILFDDFKLEIKIRESSYG